MAGIIKKIFNDLSEALKHNARIKADKEIIQSTANFQIECIETIKKEIEHNNKHSVNTDTNENISSWEGSAGKLFKQNMECRDLETVIDKYSDLMTNNGGANQYGHSFNNKILFLNAAQEIHPNNIMEFTDYVSKNQTIKKSIQINDGGEDIFMHGLLIMAKKCPNKDKIKLYDRLEDTGILDDIFKHSGGTGNIALFALAALETLDTDTALRRLKFSEAWKNVPKDKNLYGWLNNGNDCLLPAMDYKNTPDNCPTQEIG